MKRIIVVAAAITALVFAAVALAGTRTYKGFDKDSKCGTIGPPPHTRDCQIKFKGKTKTKHGKTKVIKVTGFLFNRIPMVCDNGPNSVSNTDPPSPLPNIRVKKGRKFSAHLQNSTGSQHLDLTGKFSKNYKKATGTFNFRGDFTSPTLNCKTGTDHYTVKR